MTEIQKEIQKALDKKREELTASGLPVEKMTEAIDQYQRELMLTQNQFRQFADQMLQSSVAGIATYYMQARQELREQKIKELISRMDTGTLTGGDFQKELGEFDLALLQAIHKVTREQSYMLAGSMMQDRWPPAEFPFLYANRPAATPAPEGAAEEQPRSVDLEVMPTAG